MASKKFNKGSEEWIMFMDFWNLCQEYWEIEDTDEYWENLVKNADIFYRKHNHRFARELAIAFVNYLEYVSKGKINGKV